MTLRVEFHPAALGELHAAERWYERASPGVGADFLAEVWQAIDHAVDWPGAGPQVASLNTSEEIRRTAVNRFPYRIVYLVLADKLSIVAVAHSHRRPGYWHDRLTG